MSRAVVGSNCTGCGRWRPAYAHVCSECKLPSPRRQVENLLAFLSGESGVTRPGARKAEGRRLGRSHGAQKPRQVQTVRNTGRAEPLQHNLRLVRERLEAKVPVARVAKELGIAYSTVQRLKKRFLHG